MLRRSLVFLAGFVAGIFVILALMLALGHLEPYVAGLERRFSTSSGYSPYQYVTGSLLSQIASDYDRMARVTALAASALAVLTVVLRRHWRWRLTAALILGLATFWTYNRYAVMFPWWILAITAAVAFAYTRKGHESAGVSRAADSRVFLIVLALLAISLGYVYSMLEGVWLVPGLLIVFLVHRIVYAETTPHRLAAGLALAALVITPLGSSNGMINAMFGMWLAIPLAFAVLVRRVEESADPAGAGAPALFLILVVASALAGAATRISYYSTYRDTMDRTRMTASIDHPLLRGVLTTPERASVVQELLPALGSRVHAGEPLLLHGGCALVHLLTDTRPVLGSTWNGVYDPPRFHELLVRFGRSDADLPLVLLSKGSCRDREWPLSRGVKPGEVAKRKLLRKFLHARDYALVWQNEYFEIWEAPSGVGSAPPDGSPGRSTREDARAAR